MDRFTQAMRDSGVRLTHQRLEIFREVAGTGDHPDAEIVFRRVRERMLTISLDTVYRTLWMLNDMGLVTTLGPQRGRAGFDGNASPHHHFVCTKCGMVADFYSSEFDGLEVPAEVENIGDVTTTNVQFRGICSQCREKEGKYSLQFWYLQRGVRFIAARCMSPDNERRKLHE